MLYLLNLASKERRERKRTFSSGAALNRIMGLLPGGGGGGGGEKPVVSSSCGEGTGRVKSRVCHTTGQSDIRQGRAHSLKTLFGYEKSLQGQLKRWLKSRAKKRGTALVLCNGVLMKGKGENSRGSHLPSVLSGKLGWGRPKHLEN